MTRAKTEDTLAESFALHAFTQQPGAHLAHGAATFARYLGPKPNALVFLSVEPPRPLADSWEAVARADQSHSGATRVYAPARWLRAYQRVARPPGLADLLAALLSVFALVRSRHNWEKRQARFLVALCVVCALSLLLVVSLTTVFVARYRAPTVPLLAVSAAVSAHLLSGAGRNKRPSHLARQPVSSGAVGQH